MACLGVCQKCSVLCVNPLNTQLNPICHLLALLGAHHIFHISRIRVKGHILQYFVPVDSTAKNYCLDQITEYSV